MHWISLAVRDQYIFCHSCTQYYTKKDNDLLFLCNSFLPFCHILCYHLSHHGEMPLCPRIIVCSSEKMIHLLPENLDWSGRKLSQHKAFPVHNLDLKEACFTWPSIRQCQNLSNSSLEWMKRNRHLKNPQPLTMQKHHPLNKPVHLHWFMRDPRNLSTMCKSSLHMLEVRRGKSIDKDLVYSSHLQVLPVFPLHVYFSG